MREMALGPDGENEHLFRPLEEVDSVLAHDMRHRFVEKWLLDSGFPPSRRAEALTTVDVRIGPDDAPGTNRLRITSTFSGTTRWLYGWQRERTGALDFAEEAANEEAR
ncbi:MAG TPA: hypothetical protein VGV93_07055, partial [Acidimicrobiales bacterium]|nr:hypothetical protein [Acidimicrobiales bacterium]